MTDFHARMRSTDRKPRPGTPVVVMKMRDTAQDFEHALSEAQHLMRFGVPREQAFARVGLTVDQVEKRESRERAS